MIGTGLRMAALGGAGVLIAIDPQGLALTGVLITSLAGLVAQYMKNRDDSAREERRHRFSVEDAERTAEVRLAIDQGIREASAKADRAYDAANHVNDKIQLIAQATLDAAKHDQAESDAQKKASG